jgi:hypothetical protein
MEARKQRTRSRVCVCVCVCVCARARVRVRVSPGIQLMASCMLSMHSTTGLHPPALRAHVYNKAPSLKPIMV